jgi:hypothetical protein
VNIWIACKHLLRIHLGRFPEQGYEELAGGIEIFAIDEYRGALSAKSSESTITRNTNIVGMRLLLSIDGT